MQDKPVRRSSGAAPHAPLLEDFSFFKSLRPFSPTRMGTLAASASFRRDFSAISANLDFCFELRGPHDQLGQLDLPPLKPWPLRVRQDELWKETCFEFFVHAPPDDAYFEFNVSPNGDWAVYGFDGYRMGMRGPQLLAAPHVHVARSADVYTLSGRLAAGEGDDHRWLELIRAAELNLGASCVLRPIVVTNAASGSGEGDPSSDPEASTRRETPDRREYWALRHDGEKPDFHLATSFIFELK